MPTPLRRIFDLERRIMEANDAFLSIVGYNRDDVISGRLRQTHPCD
jgi:PAS domain-containing protein